jgi:hypothetical protein
VTARNLDSYLAGLFDGEGWITVKHKIHGRQRCPYTKLVVGVGMVTPAPLALLSDRFGGNRGAYLHRRSLMHQWYVCGANATPALEVFASLCLVKREQALLALEMCALLAAPKVRAGRKYGERIMSDEETARRVEIAELVTSLKRTT